MRGELRADALAIEPVKRLAGSDEINAVIGQRGRFRGRGDADEAIIAAQQLFAGLAHLAIGLNSQNSIARLEEQFGQQARARADIGHDRVRRQPTFRGKQVDDGRRIRGPILHVVGHTAGKSLSGISHL